ncbi:toll/interleukin-1 receptor domain-containing protein [Flavihumibacter cheonanensis]|uniref:toll/interleukin-1 receptor domain-containing protein n=1 Tax=Flavihumibacter cheonanensis TaxID=1442385 RepID=UPI001EF80505|nr:toll/interleukin-1 receptor domain-containing protein [Flavihumibacter cheonanensis]MCG7753491.1 toll/interleukin-1 receptor domain-containing protein [Flavihumibacter cheonanensis]
MKPKVFLSHSKKDKDFIIKIAESLRLARIECWYDDWEIPPGESIRRKIFEDGLPSCDLFLIYLSEHSISSYWVQKELDSMLSIESESKDKLLLPFINKNELRASLSPDLKALSVPELNNENYIEPICKLIARTWEIFSNKQLNKQKEGFLHSQTLLRNQVLELENKILQIQLSGNADIERLRQNLQNTKYTHNEVTLTLEEIFKSICVMLADGSSKYDLTNKISHDFKYEHDVWGFGNNQIEFAKEIPELLGRLVILGVITRIPSTSEYVNEEYSLSSFGIKVANKLMT